MIHTRRSTLFTLVPSLLALLLASLACNAAAETPTPSFNGLETMVAATLQAIGTQSGVIPTFPPPTALPTFTSLPPTPVIPPTPVFTPTNPFIPPPATRIYFSSGATQSITTGNIRAGETITFTARALEGQPLIAEVDSPGRGVRMAIFGADGHTLLSASHRADSWQGILPATQDYYFQLIGGPSVETFNLNITLAARVQFDPGAVKTTLKGNTRNGYPVTFAAYAFQGQKMDVILTVPGDLAALSIWGFIDGESYARAQNGILDFSLDLPSTQDYMISVVPKAGEEVNFSLLIKIK